jgi:hypothetical protein
LRKTSTHAERGRFGCFAKNLHVYLKRSLLFLLPILFPMYSFYRSPSPPKAPSPPLVSVFAGNLQVFSAYWLCSLYRQYRLHAHDLLKHLPKSIRCHVRLRLLKLSLPAHEPILSFKCRWEQRPSVRAAQLRVLREVADTWACPTKRGSQQPARFGLRLVH